MLTIHLNNLQFHSFHGVHDEERILGNAFEVNVAVTIDGSAPVTSLQQTVNYELLYAIIVQRMGIPTALLETVAQDLAQLIHVTDHRIRSITVAIQKKYPPLIAMQGTVGVTYKKEF
jgi:dihydroneopterin aldolase